MTESGLIVRKTLAHVDRRLLDESSFVFVESDAYVRCFFHLGSKAKYYPMVSSFLGAKMSRVKRREVDYLLSVRAKQILYFPDLRTVKYGELDRFQDEVAFVDEEASGTNIILYVAVDFLTPRELKEVIEATEGRRLEAMLGFGGCDKARKMSAAEIAAATCKLVPKEKLWCAFWDAEELEKSRSSLVGEGIQWIAGVV